MPLASAIMLQAAVKLNDSIRQLYTNEVLLPHLITAWNILQEDARNNGLPVTRDSGALITLPAGNTEISASSTPALPVDLISVISIEEKRVGETDEFYDEVKPVDNLPADVPSSSLRYWSWNEDRIEFLGATEDRALRVKYIRSLVVITSESTNIPTLGASTYLEFKTAALAAAYIGQNYSRADRLEAEAARAKQAFLSTGVRSKHNRTVVRRPYRHGRRTK